MQTPTRRSERAEIEPFSSSTATMGICHPKPSPPKTPLDDDALPLVDTRPPEYSTGPPPPSRQDIIDQDHHRRLLAVAAAAVTLAAEGGYYNTDKHSSLTPAARSLMACVGAIADARGRHVVRVRYDRLQSALPEMNVLFLAGDAVGKVVDAVLDIMVVT